MNRPFNHPLAGTVSPHGNVAVPATLWAMPNGPRLAVLRNRSRLRVSALAGAIAIALAGCGPSASSGDPDRSEKLERGEVAKAAVAPDGTVLWVAMVGGRSVYFSSGGAQWSETHTCGRNCIRTVNYDVPNGGRQ